MGSWKSSGYGCFVINSGLQQYRVKAMLRVLINAQITGKGCRALRQLPATVYDRLQSSSHDIAHLCIELDNALVVNDVNSCQEALSKSAQSLCECNNTNHQLNRKAFVLFGGDILLLRALFLKFPSPADVEKLSFTVKVLYIRNECLSILRELCLTVHSFIEYLAADDVFVVKLFDMMRLHNTFDNAVNLAEEVLAIRQDTWPVQGVPNLTSLVSNFSSRQLASFCRVLAMVVFEPEEQSSESCMQQKSRIEEPEWTTTDKNHEAILLIPNILSRLVKLLALDIMSISREANLLSEPSEVAVAVPMRSTLERMYNAFRVTRGQLLDETGAVIPQLEGLQESDPASHLQQERTGLNSADERILDWSIITYLDRTGLSTSVVQLAASHHVEVLFVLCALCGGKKREQVQNSLAELGLVSVLDDMFDKLDWVPTQPRAHSRGIHGLICACSPKSALKIQYLRLIHNFCDRDSCNRTNKQLLLVPSVSKESNSCWTDGAEIKGSNGLIVKVLKILVDGPGDSLYRCWLASCVEAFLRGADPKDQETVASTGLMEHLLREILKGGFRCASTLQINFDLLGELIKFNKSLFQRLDGLLVGDAFDQFVEVLVTNLVDSNVFIRSVVLSLNCLKRTDVLTTDLSPNLYPCSLKEKSMRKDRYIYESKQDENYNKIAAFISHNTLRLLRDLMCAVRLNDINQDNICVVNTALIIFISVEKNGELLAYLQGIRAADRRVLNNFRSLLEFWRSYYLTKRGRECVSLQYSTQLPFSAWLHIVDLLCSHPDSPYSLLYASSVDLQDDQYDWK
ncbi:uncharacterized protein [Physcomitrium patens]|uniref:Uncharacterized protein n=2 Tax=Physcomitrium patens TaxID=3218 RepID=A0A7I4AYE3_PHYPA|nr:short transient receptor potential channel 4-associated protein-like isoform X2 [Physcomitrium patens]|eukprot:XP_024395590.1 short transient receptor potential channel 4-associated protein-like isoform X2 [Physcomitrella patens]